MNSLLKKPLVVIIAIICLSIAIISYFLHSKHIILQNQIQNWSDFASTFSAIVGFVNLLIFIYLTLKVFVFQQKSFSEQIDLNRKIKSTEIRKEAITDFIEILCLPFNPSLSTLQEMKDMYRDINQRLTKFLMYKNNYFMYFLSDEKSQLTLKVLEDIFNKLNSLIIKSCEVPEDEIIPQMNKIIPVYKEYLEIATDFSASLSNYAFCQYERDFESKNDTKSNYVVNGVGVGALIINSENEILLLKREKDPEKNHWSIPGGKVEYGEKVEDAILREVKEETGLDCKIEKFVGYSNHILHDAPPCHWVALSFKLSNTTSNSPVNLEKEAHSDLQWFSLDELPDKLTIPTQKALTDYRKIV